MSLAEREEVLRDAVLALLEARRRFGEGFSSTALARQEDAEHEVVEAAVAWAQEAPAPAGVPGLQHDPAEERPCRSCGAPVIWRANRSTGRLAPIDARPVAGGNITLDRDAYVLHDVRGRVRTEDPQGYRYVSHFASCPNARAHRVGVKR